MIFDRLPEDHVVQMFVTINAKHTRLNASHLVSLSGRQLYRDENLAAAHDIVRALSENEDSPLHGEIKLLGVGHGRVAQAPLAQELKKLFTTDAFGPATTATNSAKRQAFLRELFPPSRARVRRRVEWTQIQHKSASALRAFIRVAPDIVKRLDQQHLDRSDFRAIGRVIAPWGRRIGDLRFETDGAWKSEATVDQLAKELRFAPAVSRRRHGVPSLRQVRTDHELGQPGPRNTPDSGQPLALMREGTNLRMAVKS